MSLAAVILSKSIANLGPCLDAVRAREPRVRLHVVDDGLAPNELNDVYYRQADIVLGQKPFVFARNANIGLRYAFESLDTDAVVLLNDDALLETPQGFTKMYQQWERSPEFGLIASSTNNVGNVNQHPKGASFIRVEHRMLCFVCVLIPRSTWERVGPLDERFVHYGWEDNDYSRRVREAGLKLGISDRCFVDHGRLKSTFRGDHGADIEPNRKLYLEKWGAKA